MDEKDWDDPNLIITEKFGKGVLFGSILN